MFDFEKLDVYKRAKEVVVRSLQINYSSGKMSPDLKDQWRRASLSVVLNIAEGTGRISKADKKRFYTISRSSVFECAAIIDIALNLQLISKPEFDELYEGYERVSKMLLGLYRSCR